MRTKILWCFFVILFILFIWNHYRCYRSNTNEEFKDEKIEEKQTTWFQKNISLTFPEFNYDYLTYFPRFLGNWTYSCFPSRTDPSLVGRGLNQLGNGYGRPKK